MLAWLKIIVLLKMLFLVMIFVQCLNSAPTTNIEFIMSWNVWGIPFDESVDSLDWRKDIWGIQAKNITDVLKNDSSKRLQIYAFQEVWSYNRISELIGKARAGKLNAGETTVFAAEAVICNFLPIASFIRDLAVGQNIGNALKTFTLQSMNVVTNLVPNTFNFIKLIGGARKKRKKRRRSRMLLTQYPVLNDMLSRTNLNVGGPRIDLKEKLIERFPGYASIKAESNSIYQDMMQSILPRGMLPNNALITEDGRYNSLDSGLLILSNWKPDKMGFYRYTNIPQGHEEQFAGKGILWAMYNNIKDVLTTFVFNTHLTSNVDTIGKQMRELFELISRVTTSSDSFSKFEVYVMGDFNIDSDKLRSDTGKTFGDMGYQLLSDKHLTDWRGTKDLDQVWYKHSSGEQLLKYGNDSDYVGYQSQVFPKEKLKDPKQVKNGDFPSDHKMMTIMLYL